MVEKCFRLIGDYLVTAAAEDGRCYQGCSVIGRRWTVAVDLYYSQTNTEQWSRTPGPKGRCW